MYIFGEKFSDRLPAISYKNLETNLGLLAPSPTGETPLATTPSARKERSLPLRPKLHHPI